MNTLEQKFRNLLVNLHATVHRQHKTETLLALAHYLRARRRMRLSIGMWHMCHILL